LVEEIAQLSRLNQAIFPLALASSATVMMAWLHPTKLRAEMRDEILQQKNPKKLTPKQQPTQVTHLTAQIKLLLNPQGIEAGPLSFCRIKLSRIKLSLTVLA